ncbi:MAG: DMT family transporter [Lachnospiraceae bacterium]|uniref:DMT family transporter n=1 Tax=Candidatus Weimeria bifida TaxID=2599074 RepID=A0A6N7J3Q3_9FIRM|nr:DMT family transporter [Candidatus Weimeria bifida]RRF97403.1 MAG: DMT family transporter [Lachnospiraceae bacterium]
MRDNISTVKNNHAIGIGLVIADSFFFSLMTLFVRLSGDLPTMQKCFFRNAIAAVVAVITLLRTDEKFHIKKGSMPGLLMRSICGGLGMICNFYAIDRIGLADANILNKMSPFFAIIASIFVLKEIPKKADWIAVIIAFAGSIFIIKPSFNVVSLYSLAGLLGGLGAGIAYTYVRKLGQHGERGPVIVAFFSIFTCCLCLPFMIADFHPMTWQQWLFLILAGFAAAGGQFTVTAAYKFAPAKNISVFDYSQVIFASIWGVAFFGEIPDMYSIIGYVIVIGCAVFRWLYLMKTED